MDSDTEAATASATSARILDIAERLAQTRGFNGFSYADISSELGITKASLHYHFATKATLGRALLLRYSEKFFAALTAIDAEHDASRKLRRYASLYEQVLVRDRMCLCGMLAAEYSTLPAAMQLELRRFFDKNETWLARCLEDGRAGGTLEFEGNAVDAARVLTAGLEGAMLLARCYGEPARFAVVAKRLLSELDSSHSAVRASRRVKTAPRAFSRRR
jgi:TetR/AcrR family transcriptional repressor of nem operon